MSPLLRKVSGKDCLKILCNKFGFKIARQRGSHVLITKETEHGKVGTVIPQHMELKIGTLKAILEQAKISENEFSKFI
ncbi:MAG: type II toxin-antitoxin system HicA family toxin [Candidatus Pacearchaeota archaeon]|nr:type II toxin-antitoxin system HicA family toxin [Candidatus Pacearchaeota archaeon]